MDISVIRTRRGPHSTLSTLSIDGKFFCYILEDTDRGLRSDMPLSEIQSKKFKRATAIPEGKYQVIVNMSARFKKQLPLLLNVPGYEGIRIHPGNTHMDTEGCLLPGERWTSGSDFNVLNSRQVFERLFALIQARIQLGEKIWCKISNAY